MRNDIYWLVDCKVKPGKLEDYQAAIRPLIEATRAEPGNHTYDYSISDDGTRIMIFERYDDSEAIVSHVTQVFSQYAEGFSAGVDIESFTVFAEHLSPEAKEILDAFGCTYMASFDGYLDKELVRLP